jgi:hypothetical protein
MPATAAKIEQITVERNGKLINVNASMLIYAPRALVFIALADYDRFSDLSDAYVESRFIEPAADGTPRIYTRVEGCIWFFCRTIERYARLELEPITRIVASVEPELSDADYAREQWDLEPLGKVTRVYYKHDLEPNFWVPPGIGTWAIRRVLEKSATKAADRIEKLAQRISAEAAAAAESQEEGL